MEIQSDKHLRISRSGLSLNIGWSDEKRVVASCPVSLGKIVEQDGKAYKQWLEDAEKICRLWNAELEPLPESLRDPEKVLERGQKLLSFEERATELERVLKLAKYKLEVYHDQTKGVYGGGPEYSALMNMIEATLLPAGSAAAESAPA